MKYSVYAVKDELVGFMQPFILQNDQQALRSFEATVNATDGNPIAKAFKDMSFYRLGTYDDQTGVLTSDVQKLASGASVFKDVAYLQRFETKREDKHNIPEVK